MCDCHVASPGGPGENRMELRQKQVGVQISGRNTIKDTKSVLHVPLQLSVDFRGVMQLLLPLPVVACTGHRLPSHPCIETEMAQNPLRHILDAFIHFTLPERSSYILRILPERLKFHLGTKPSINAVYTDLFITQEFNHALSQVYYLFSLQNSYCFSRG